MPVIARAERDGIRMLVSYQPSCLFCICNSTQRHSIGISLTVQELLSTIRVGFRLMIPGSRTWLGYSVQELLPSAVYPS